MYMIIALKHAHYYEIQKALINSEINPQSQIKCRMRHKQSLLRSCLVTL